MRREQVATLAKAEPGTTTLQPSAPRRWYELVSEATACLGEAGIQSPRRDAQELAAFVLGTPLSKLALHYRQVPSPEQSAAYRQALEQRARRVPLQLITGIAGFRTLELEVYRGVFIPRPETEILVEVVLEHLRKGPPDQKSGRIQKGPHIHKSPQTRERSSIGKNHRICTSRPAKVLDVGTGSGAIALSLAAEATEWRILATDISMTALECARGNAERLGLEEQVSFLACKSLSALGNRAEGRFEAIVSNPPYVPSGAIDALDPEVRDHDPREALDGGPDGLSFVRHLLCASLRYLSPAGMVAMEVGEEQAEVLAADPLVVEALRRYDMTLLPPYQDLAGRPRVIAALKRARVGPMSKVAAGQSKGTGIGYRGCTSATGKRDRRGGSR